MTMKQIETAREIRLWIGQIIAPVTLGAVLLLSNPKVQRKLERSINKSKQFIKAKFAKKENDTEVNIILD